MTVIDLTLERPRALTRADCYAPILDARLAHQLVLENRHRGFNQSMVYARCNCGAEIAAEYPNADGALDRIKASYARHVTDVLS